MILNLDKCDLRSSLDGHLAMILEVPDEGFDTLVVAEIIEKVIKERGSEFLTDLILMSENGELAKLEHCPN